jgi:hypothetical protein
MTKFKAQLTGANYKRLLLAKGTMKLQAAVLYLFASGVYAQSVGATDGTAVMHAMRAACPANACSMSLEAKTYVVNNGIFDIAGSSTTSAANASLIGAGKATQIVCSPSTVIEACVRVYNGALSTIQNLAVRCNSNVTYCIEYISRGSAEDGDMRNVAVSGGQYGIAISPTQHWDISHINMYDVSMRNAAVADLVVGDGVQSNVLDNRCFGCTFDTGGGDGILIRGGGFSCYGCDWDENKGIDVHVTTPPDQVLVLHGGRSEGSAAFYSFSIGGGSAMIPGTSIDGISWFAGKQAAKYAITHVYAAPISITNSRFGSIYNTVNFNLGSNNPNFPTPIYMSSVGVSNANWSSVLAGMLAQPMILYSVNDYYFNPATFQLGRGSGQIWSSSRLSAQSEIGAQRPSTR